MRPIREIERGESALYKKDGSNVGEQDEVGVQGCPLLDSIA